MIKEKDEAITIITDFEYVINFTFVERLKMAGLVWILEIYGTYKYP